MNKMILLLIGFVLSSYLFAQPLASIPEMVDYRKDMLPVRDQTKDGNCLAIAATSVIEWQRKSKEYFSPRFIYDNRKDAHELDVQDLILILKTKGVCFEKSYPIGTSGNISDKAFREALNYTISDCKKIKSIDELKAALYLNGLCIICFQIYNRTNQMWKPIDGNRVIGMHSMCIVGYNSNGFILRNSWGANWGDGGYCVFPYTDWKWQWECWTLIK